MILLKQLTPNLMVNNVNETVNFYQKILGFELVMSVPQEGVFNWAMVQHGEVSLMFQEKENIIVEYPVLKDTPLGGGLTFYIKVGDVKGLYNKIREQVNIVLDLHKTFYGAEEFAIQDINGFVLTFADDASGAEI
jgi:lactoylglutathione lyase